MKKTIFVVLILMTILVCTLTACQSSSCKNGKHTWVDKEVISEATCDTVGRMRQKCDVCGVVTRDVAINATGHNYGSWIPNADGLTHSRICATDGSHVETASHIDADANNICDNCGFILVAPECQHTWGDWSYNSDGTHTRVCEKDATHTETVNCSGGTATCEEDGVCAFCGGAYISEIGHNYPETWTNNGDGTHTKVCLNQCGIDLTETHNHVETGRTPATCEDAELITYTCVCGDTYTEEGDPATDHNYPETWTNNGDGTHTKVCANQCGIDLTEAHNHVETGRTPATCEDAELITYTCVCGDTHNEEGDPATDHNYPETWTNNGDGTHTKVCLNQCGIDLTEVHNHVEIDRVDADCENDGEVTYQCVCSDSYKETIDATGHGWGEWISHGNGSSTRICANNESHTETLVFIQSKAAVLDKGFALRYYMNSTSVEGMDDLNIEFLKPVYGSDGSQTITTSVIYDYKIYTNQSGVTYYTFDYSDIFASELGSEITAVVRSGETVLTEFNYSIKEYVCKMLNELTLSASESNLKLRTLLVDILNYGAAAQVYFNRNSENLVNADLTEEQRSWATQETPEMVSGNMRTDAVEGEPAFEGISVSLQSTIQTVVRINPGNYDFSEFNVVINYVDLNGYEQQKVIDSTEIKKIETVTPQGDIFVGYYVEFNEYGARQLRDQATFTFVEKASGEQIGNTQIFSLEGYFADIVEMANVSEELINVVIAAMKYGDSANAYFSAR